MLVVSIDQPASALRVAAHTVPRPEFLSFGAPSDGRGAGVGDLRTR